MIIIISCGNEHNNQWKLTSSTCLCCGVIDLRKFRSPFNLYDSVLKGVWGSRPQSEPVGDS